MAVDDDFRLHEGAIGGHPAGLERRRGQPHGRAGAGRRERAAAPRRRAPRRRARPTSRSTSTRRWRRSTRATRRRHRPRCSAGSTGRTRGRGRRHRPDPASQRAGAGQHRRAARPGEPATARRCARSSATASAWSRRWPRRRTGPGRRGRAPGRAARRHGRAPRRAQRAACAQLGARADGGPPGAGRAGRRPPPSCAGWPRPPARRSTRSGPLARLLPDDHARRRPADRARPAGWSSTAPGCMRQVRPIARGRQAGGDQARGRSRATRCRSPASSRSTCPRRSARSRTSAPPRAPTTPTATSSTSPRPGARSLPDSTLAGGELGPADCDRGVPSLVKPGPAAEAVHPRAGRQRVPAVDRPARRASSTPRPAGALMTDAVARVMFAVTVLLLVPTLAFLLLSSQPTPGRRQVVAQFEDALPAGRGDERARRRRDRRLGRAGSPSTTTGLAEVTLRARRRGRGARAPTPPRRSASRTRPATATSRSSRARSQQPLREVDGRPTIACSGGARGALPAHAGRAAPRRPAQRVRALRAHRHPAHAHRARAGRRRARQGPQPRGARPAPRPGGGQPRAGRRQPPERGAARLHRRRRGGHRARRPGAARSLSRSIDALAATLQTTAAETQLARRRARAAARDGAPGPLDACPRSGARPPRRGRWPWSCATPRRSWPRRCERAPAFLADLRSFLTRTRAHARAHPPAAARRGPDHRGRADAGRHRAVRPGAGDLQPAARRPRRGRDDRGAVQREVRPRRGLGRARQPARLPGRRTPTGASCA